MLTLAAAAVIILLIIVVRGLARWAVMLVLRVSSSLPAKLPSSRVWAASQTLRSYLAERFPAFSKFVANRVEPRHPSGLLLTLMVLVTAYFAALFSGLTEEILEADGILQFDNLVNAWLDKWRVEPLTSTFLWVTALGASPAILAAAIIATGFLWAYRRVQTIVALWVTCSGALAMTSIGKLLIGRQRPETTIDVSVVSSSFPSGHATAAMAVYGFIAYAIARVLPNARERFEIAYWSMALVVLIGFSRIFLGVHFLTDIVGGFLVGAFWLLIGFAIAEWKRADAYAPSDCRNKSTQDRSLPGADSP